VAVSGTDIHDNYLLKRTISTLKEKFNGFDETTLFRGKII
jgi:hypothetical protein